MKGIFKIILSLVVLFLFSFSSVSILAEGSQDETDHDSEASEVTEDEEVNPEEQTEPVANEDDQSDEVDQTEEASVVEDEVDDEQQEQASTFSQTSANEAPPSFGEGDNGPHVTELKQKLTKLGIGNYPSNPSIVYGGSTTHNVSEFQRYYGLEVTGRADEETLAVLESNANSPYQDGESGDHIVELKQKLTLLGIGNYPSNPSGNFGGSTEVNVRRFQEMYELNENGIGDDVTLAKLDEVIIPQDGVRGQHVVELKQGLRKLGIGNYPANPSNFFGNSTTVNVSEFQRYYGLTVDGIAGEETLNALERNLNSPYQNGESGEHVVELKKNLSILGIGNYPENPSGNFGGSTEVNLRRFQQMYDLNENGIGDDVTIATLNEQIIPQDGVRGPHVVELKQGLRKLGIGNYPANPSSFFGDSTTYNVSEFQRYYGLPVDGIAGEETLALLDENVNSEYQDGARGVHVVELKQKLSRLGIGNYPENPSGNFGRSTDSNVRAFQRYYGLNENGIADTVTLAKIEEILSSSYQSGNRGAHVVELKQNLSRLGIGNYPENPSNNFGDSTAANVRAFQRYYGLNENGIADEVTLSEIESILKSPYQNGNRGAHVVELKQNLSRLGVGNYPENPSDNFGGSTAANVRAFQSYYGLNESGIADDVTLDKIREILNSPYRSGQRGSHVVELKQNLSALFIGNYPENPSGSYGGSTEYNVMEFQRLYDLNINGIADEVTLNKLDELLRLNRYDSYDITVSQALTIQMRARPQTDQNYAYVSAAHIDSNNRVSISEGYTLIVRSRPNSNGNHIGNLENRTRVNVISEVDGWYQIEYSHNRWVDAARADVRYYLDPANFLNNERQKFQFLDLSRRSGATRSVLNNYLSGRGILDGKGAAFLAASHDHNVNAIYLLAHALLETGHGTSRLSTGIEVGMNNKGNLEIVDDQNRDKLSAIQTTYNMFGVRAVDNDPIRGGAFHAYRQGWFTPEAAINGGAVFISNNYVNAGQNTLYKMRWNPVAMDRNGVASHQYATDIGWAYKQVNSIYNLYQELNITNLYFEVPQYSN